LETKAHPPAMEEIGQGRLAVVHMMAVREASLQNRKWNQQHTLIRKKNTQE
jgi:hypothetical protein